MPLSNWMANQVNTLLYHLHYRHLIANRTIELFAYFSINYLHNYSSIRSGNY